MTTFVCSIDGMITYTIRCAHCPATAEQTSQVRTTYSVPYLLTPEGWRQLPHGVVCPAHRIQYIVDGVTQEYMA